MYEDKERRRKEYRTERGLEEAETRAEEKMQWKNGKRREDRVEVMRID